MSFEKILENLEKMPEDQKELKDGLVVLIKGLNQEKGSALSDLSRFKETNKELLDKTKDLEKGNASYTELLTLLGKQGIEAKEAEKILKSLKVDKTAADELEALKKITKDQETKLKGYNEVAAKQKIKDALNPKIDVAIKQFKDKDGREYFLSRKFLNEEEVFKEIDVTSDVLVNDRITKGLTDAHEKQEKFKEDTGMDFTRKVHKVDVDGDRHYSDNGGKLDGEKLMKNIRDEHGSLDSVTRGIAEFRQSNENNGS